MAIVGMFVFIIGLCISSFLNSSENYNNFYLSSLQNILRHLIVNGRITTGFLYIPLGMLLWNKTLNFNRGVLLISCSVLFYFLEDYQKMMGNYWGYEIAKNISIIFCSLGIWICFMKIKLRDKLPYSKLRLISTVMYFTHLWIWSILYLLIYKTKTFGGDMWIGSVLGTILLSIIWMKIRSNRFFVEIYSNNILYKFLCK